MTVSSFDDLKVSLLEGKNANKELVLDFFLAFSRLDYAMKRLGSPYVEEAGTGLRMKYSELVKETVGEDQRKMDQLRNTAAYLLEKPVQKQCMDGDRVKWKPAEPNGSPQVGR